MKPAKIELIGSPEEQKAVIASYQAEAAREFFGKVTAALKDNDYRVLPDCSRRKKDWSVRQSARPESADPSAGRGWLLAGASAALLMAAGCTSPEVDSDNDDDDTPLKASIPYVESPVGHAQGGPAPKQPEPQPMVKKEIEFYVNAENIYEFDGWNGVEGKVTFWGAHAYAMDVVKEGVEPNPNDCYYVRLNAVLPGPIAVNPDFKDVAYVRAIVYNVEGQKIPWYDAEKREWQDWQPGIALGRAYEEVLVDQIRDKVVGADKKDGRWDKEMCAKPLES